MIAVEAQSRAERAFEDTVTLLLLLLLLLLS